MTIDYGGPRSWVFCIWPALAAWAGYVLADEYYISGWPWWRSLSLAVGIFIFTVVSECMGVFIFKEGLEQYNERRDWEERAELRRKYGGD